MKYLLVASIALILSSAQGQDDSDEDSFQEFSFTNFNVTTTTDTLVLQSIDSQNAQLIDAGKTIRAIDVLIQIPQLETGNVVVVSAPACLYYFQAAPALEPVTEADLPEYQDELIEFNSVAVPGRDDLLLYDPDDTSPIKIDLGTEGEIVCRNLYWNESARMFLSGGYFYKRRPFDGDDAVIRGTGFLANEDFTAIYYNKPTQIIFQKQGTP
ncbi:MAG: hypothetical protein SFY68_12805 [Candidatus Sumerlaeia bacterium]|nr:hypothetical protein [Candidatus Sumerlaeia bacterium]